jgi:hypothetical protein
MADAANKKQVEKAASDEKSAAAIAKGDIQWVMSDPRGRRVVGELIDRCKIFESAFSPNGSITNFKLGEQNTGLWLFARIDAACPELYLAMRREKIASEEK